MDQSRVIVIRGDARELLRQLTEAFVLRDTIDKLRLTENVCVLVQDHEKDETHLRMCHNIVTDEGDKYYAQLGAGEVPFTVLGMRLGSNWAGGTGKAKTDVNTFFGVGKGVSSGYPKTNDPDPSNTGALVDATSWKSDWATSENNSTAMDEGAIVDHLTTPTVALTHFQITPSVTKTSAQTLAVFVNHRANGV